MSQPHAGAVHNLRSCAEALHALTGHEPVAITLLPERPADLPTVPVAEAGCGYWRLAEQGHTFYVAGAGHLGCPVCAYTHGLPLPLSTAQGLARMVAERPMLTYLKDQMSQAPWRRMDPPSHVLYAPLRRCPRGPDLVLLRGRPLSLMSLSEAATAAGCGEETSAAGRPVCALLPQVLSTGRVGLSLGCQGARQHAGLLPEEAYLAMPGTALLAITAQLLLLHGGAIRAEAGGRAEPGPARAEAGPRGEPALPLRVLSILPRA